MWASLGSTPPYNSIYLLAVHAYLIIVYNAEFVIISGGYVSSHFGTGCTQPFSHLTKTKINELIVTPKKI